MPAPTPAATGAVTNTSSSSPSFSIPSGTWDNKLMTVEVRISASTVTVSSGPTDWTLLPNLPQSNGGNGSLYVYAKIHDGSEVDPQVTLSGTATVYGAVTVWNDADNINLGDIQGDGAFNATSSDPVLPSLTPASADMTSVATAGSQSGAPTYATPTGYSNTNLWTLSSPEAGMWYDDTTTSGVATGTITVPSEGDRAWIGYHFLIPAAAGGAGDQTITLPLLTNSNTLFAPTITAGDVTITLPLLVNSNTLFAPTITADAVTIALPLLTNVNTLFTHTISHSANDQPITLPLLTNVSTLFAPTLSPGAATITLPLLINVSTLFPPTMTAGAVTITLPLLTNTSILFAPELRPIITLPLLVNVNVLHAPALTAGSVQIVLPLLVNQNVLYPMEIVDPDTVTKSPYPPIDSMLGLPRRRHESWHRSVISHDYPGKRWGGS